MSPDQLVVSPATAQRLVEAGWDRPTHFNWLCRAGGWFLDDNPVGPGVKGFLPAPTAEELAEVVPLGRSFTKYEDLYKVPSGWAPRSALMPKKTQPRLCEAMASDWIEDHQPKQETS